MTTNSDNPWKTHSIETAYDNDWITVTHRDVTAPTGSPAIYGMVHFKNLAVGVVPIDADGYTWLVGQYRYTLEQYTWEIPEGGGKLGEDALLAAQRELLEETGISAKRWTPLLTLHTSNSVTDEMAVTYIAQDLAMGTQSFDDTEDLEIQRVPLEIAMQMVLDGRITDSVSMASLMKIQILLDRGELQL